jgi:LemA protein
MNFMKSVLGIVVIVLAFGAIGAGCSYNKFTTQEEAVKAQWGQVENQLQRRSDLIPNLVETTKGFAAHEKDVIQAVTDAPAMAGAAPSETIAAANAESSALSRLLVVVENYPNLKSDQTFLTLMDTLTGTEGRIATERGRYNDKVRDYNQLRRSFPANITAAIFGFKEYPYFDAPNRPRRPRGGFAKEKVGATPMGVKKPCCRVRPEMAATRLVLARVPEASLGGGRLGDHARRTRDASRRFRIGAARFCRDGRLRL